MGVPKFAAWLIKKYPTMVETSCPRNVHGLYIDLNGIIHPCCHDEDDVSVAQRSDEEKLEAICRAVELLVVTTNPRELCYIAIDGVAPRAKMNQQRARRYMKSAVEQVNLDELANCTKEEYADTKNELDDVLCEMEAEMQSMGVPTQPMSHGAATSNCVKEDTRAEFDSNCLSPGTEFMTKVASSLRTFVEKKVASDDTLWRQLTFILSDTTIPGEGEHKFMDFMRTQTGRVGFGNNGAHVIVGLDADLIFLSLALHIPNVYILRDNDRHPTKPSSSSKKEDVELEGNDDDERRDLEDAAVTPCKKYEYFNIDTIGTLLVSEIYQLSIAKHFAMRGNPRAEGELQSSSGYAFDRVGGKATGELKGVSTVMHVPCPLSDPAGWMAATMANAGHSQAFHPCTTTTNAKIVDDFIVLGMLLGNDFLPRSPTIFCGEGALDTLIELYVTEVLPFGYLTLGSHEINLIQLRRLFESLAKVEAAQFRRYAVLSGEMKGSDMPVGLTWPVREEWRRVYHTTTSIGDSASDACKAYIEGLRFVWRYYSSNSDRVSWSWFYNYHHAPLAVDVVDFLRAAGDNLQTTLAPPPLEVDPPTPLCQLLCILPPSSRALVPAVFSSIMQQPPPALASTFPSAWSVDFSASFGKEHLSTVMLPFASMEDLRALVATHVAELTEEEVGRLLTTGTTATVISRLPMGHESSQSTSLTKYEVYGGVGGILEPENVPRMEGEEEGDKQPVYRYRYLMGLPECTRPRTYSWKAVIPGFNAPPNRDFGNRFRKRKGGKTETEEESPKKNNKSDDELERSMAMTFPEFLMACGAISIVMLMMAHCQFIVLLQALVVVVVALWLTGFAGLMGVYTHSKAHDALRRNYNVRRLFMDWQCPLCLQINYSRNVRCFVCEAPLDAARLVCIYSGKPTSFNAKQQDPDPPLLDPNHSTYMKHFIQGG